MIKVNDKWLRVALILLPFSIYLYNTFRSGDISPVAILIYLVSLILVCEGIRLLSYRSRQWFSVPFKTLKRVAIYFPSGILWITACIILSKVLRSRLYSGNSSVDFKEGFALHFNTDQVNLGLFGTSFLQGIFVFFLLFCVFELAYHFARLGHTEKERDRLEKEKLQAELQQLKGIVNPHFLFNNLNSLSSLISENPVRAEAFLDELTRVFRYLLRNNETELTTLAEELKFIRSYYHLLQTRFGDAISMTIKVDPGLESYLLPPLTLQLLVENAVKHNRIHKEYPLHIELRSDKEQQLVVSNNLAAREHRIESTGIGLRSIYSRYRLLNQPAPGIRKDEQHFSVIIPLIIS